MPVTPDLQKYVDDARGFGMTDAQIRTELQNSGWSGVDIDAVVGPSMTPAPVSTMPPVERPPVNVSPIPNKTAFNPVMGNGMATFNPAPAESKSYLKWVIIISLLLIIVGGSAGVYFLMPELKDKVGAFVSNTISSLIKKTPFGNSSAKSTEENNTPKEGGPIVTASDIMNQNPVQTPVVEVSTSTAPVIIKITPEEAWAVYDKYLAALQEKSKTGSVTLLNDVLINPTKECAKTKLNDCKKAALLAINLTGISDKSVFVNNVSDDKQIILYTNLKPNNSSTSLGFDKKLLFFVKDDSGSLKLAQVLSKNFAVVKSSQDAEIKLNAMVIDSDTDGLTDQEETTVCQKTNTTCVNTDPNKMDTDGNGFWDSIDKYKNEVAK